MPEAAVDEDGDLAADEGDVGADGCYHPGLSATPPKQGGEFCCVEPDAVVESVAAVAGGPESFAKKEFGLGVLCLVGAHHTRDGFALGNGRSFVADVFDGQIVTWAGQRQTSAAFVEVDVK